MTGIVNITTTGSDRNSIEYIGRQLVEMRLAACAQIMGPIKGIYWWKGKMEETEEWCCILKSRVDLYKEIEKTIVKLHPYELPEIVATGIEHASPEYVQWVTNETALSTRT